ncbi:MAG: hypothetical protein ACI9N0_000615 [Ilumatobacter sp.]|jgi:uncharacterized protein with GYD domain
MVCGPTGEPHCQDPCSSRQDLGGISPRCEIILGVSVNKVRLELKGGPMAKYMITANYSSDGMKGVLADGGTSRKAAVEALAAGVGGTVDAVYFSFGQQDVIIICDLPDEASVATIAMTVASTGAVISTGSMPLLTAEEVDAAAKNSPAYRAPGT